MLNQIDHEINKRTFAMFVFQRNVQLSDVPKNIRPDVGHNSSQ